MILPLVEAIPEVDMWYTFDIQVGFRTDHEKPTAEISKKSKRNISLIMFKKRFQQALSTNLNKFARK